ncbi:intimin [Salmonella enterica subsp. enterica]|uniref:Intimin n=1 Tax=Salmonella enterica I TaxID=59201 RepID=A0A447N6E0_SALET|nr:intimin [Salmonella enterica subsp. enterica]
MLTVSCCGATKIKTAYSRCPSSSRKKRWRCTDYQWEFTGQSTNGHTGALANTMNEDLVLPVTNKEAAQKFAANVEDGVQGYGIRVTYSQK